MIPFFLVLFINSMGLSLIFLVLNAIIIDKHFIFTISDFVGNLGLQIEHGYFYGLLIL